MDREKFLEDFEYLYIALKKHPSFFYSNNMERFYELYVKCKQKIVDYNSLVDAMTKLTMFLGDGHTNIEIPYTNDDLCLKISAYWKGERLYLAAPYGDIDIDTEIISIEEMSTRLILESLSEFIPHENIYLVKSRMIEYPYMNYHMFSKMNLQRMFGKKEAYSVGFKNKGRLVSKQCTLEKYDGYIDFRERTAAYYEIKGTTAVLHLDECICDEQYKNTLKELAYLCTERNIEKLELDLSRNMGGSSAVIDEFIKHINVDSFHRYEMIDYSDRICKINSKRSDEIPNSKAEFLFPDKLVCRISNTTFSSAKTFAVTLKDNGIAEIIGEPSGGKPNSYGMPKRDVTPNCKVRFRVSRCVFLRPNRALDEEQALFPDA